MTIDAESLAAVQCSAATSPARPHRPVAVCRRALWVALAVESLRNMCSRRGLRVSTPTTPHFAKLVIAVHGPLVVPRRPSGGTGEGFAAALADRRFDESVQILLTILHELLRTSGYCPSRKGPWIVAIAQVVELDGVPSPVSGPAMRDEQERIARSLGPYPRPGYGYIVDACHGARLARAAEVGDATCVVECASGSPLQFAYSACSNEPIGNVAALSAEFNLRDGSGLWALGRGRCR